MKRLFLFAALSAAFAATGSAATVSYTDSGTLTCGANATCVAGPANTLTFASTLLGGPSLTVVYNPGGDTQIVPPEASANYGSIAMACAGCTTANNATWDLTGTLGTVSFSQVLPAPGLNTLSGTFSSVGLGWIGPGGPGQTGSARFLFAPDSMSINSISYRVEQPAAGILLQLGQNTITGLIKDTSIPEPSTLALISIGIFGLPYLQRGRDGCARR